MSKSQIKRLTYQLTLADVEKKIEKIDDQIDKLEERRHLLKEVKMELMMKRDGLIVGVTKIRETKSANAKTGIFNGFNRKYGSFDCEWAQALMIKKDNTVGVRELTFYSWEVVK